LNLSGAFYKIKTISAKCNGSSGVSFTGFSEVRGIVTENNGSGIATSTDTVVLYNASLLDSNPINFPLAGNHAVRSQNHGGVSGDHRTFMSGATILRNPTAGETGGPAWEIKPEHEYRNISNPVPFPIGPIVLSAGTTTTITARVKRSDSGIEASLSCPGGQIAGIDADVRASCVGVGAYETVSIQLTPSEDGVVELYLYAYGGTTHSAFIERMSFSST
jgi:hypothetical protein